MFNGGKRRHVTRADDHRRFIVWRPNIFPMGTVFIAKKNMWSTLLCFARFLLRTFCQ